MKGKIRVILIYVLAALVMATMLTATVTFGRYSGEYSPEGSYGGDVEYVVSNQVEISSVEEFFAAIENGYGNIIIADEMDNPLIISGGVNDIHSDLVIDLNGHEIQRNNKQPLLNLASGVRLTIIDTAEQGGGSFYNPVGGVLQVSGGTLTVSAGLFESGPRNGEGASLSEYAAFSGNLWTTPYGATIYGDVSVSMDSAGGDKITADMPVIVPGVSFEGQGETEHKSVNGNMYFYAGYGNNDYVGADTYLYFTLDDKTVQNSSITTEGSADYLYSYYPTRLSDGNYAYNANSQSESDQNVKVTIYVYGNVKGSATETGKSYSAISMQSGNLYVRGGNYQSYFGVGSTYCVNATGGYMSVESGDFYAFDDGVCINCNYNGRDEQKEYLRVSNGMFSSEKGNTISVEEGRVLVSGGQFVKNASEFAASDFDANNSVIYMSGGSLTLGSSSTVGFTIYGDGINGIYADEGAGIQVNNADFEFLSAAAYALANADNSVSYVRGIYSGGGTVTCNGSTQIIIGDCGTATSGGSSNIGIHADGGRVECKGTTLISVSRTEGAVAGKSNYGIFADSGTVDCEGSVDISVCGSLSTGIYANGGNVAIGGEQMEDSFDCFVKMPQNDKTLSSTAVSAIGGDIDFYANEAKITSNGLGVTVGGGNVTFGDEVRSVSLTAERGTALYIYGGSLNLVGNNTTLNISSTIEEGTSWATDSSEGSSGQTNTGVNIYNGVYIQGGSLNSAGTFNVEHKGLANSVGGSDMIKSYAVRVEGTQAASASVHIAYGTIKNSVGGGIYVKGGSLSAGSSAGTTTINSEGYAIAMRGNAAEDTASISGKIVLETTKSAAIYITGGSLTFNQGSDATITSVIDASYTFCNNADKVSYDGIYINAGSFIADGTVNITHTGLENDAYGDGENSGLTADSAYRDFKIKSYAVRVDGTDDTEVRMLKGEITNSSGGGVYVSGGKVTLGAQDAQSDLSVKATGNQIFTSDYYSISGAAKNWGYKLPSKGGPAVKVDGGRIDIYYGSYSSAQGDGIVLKNGTVNVYGGTFTGADIYKGADTYDTMICGPGASYCLKVFGGTANISDGTFGSAKDASSAISGSGAFVMGTSGTDKGVANISGGVFNVAGQAAFSIYQYAEVTFGKANTASDIYLRGYAAGLVVEETKSGNIHLDTQITVVIYDGEFRGYRSSGGDGIWTGNVYADFRIYGGEFFGETRNGLNVGGGTVQIYGGKFYGYNANAVNGNYSAVNATRHDTTETVDGKNYNLAEFV